MSDSVFIPDWGSYCYLPHQEVREPSWADITKNLTIAEGEETSLSRFFFFFGSCFLIRQWWQRYFFVGLKRPVLIKSSYITAKLLPTLVKCIKVEFGYVSAVSCNFCNVCTLEFFQLYKFKCFKMLKKSFIPVRINIFSISGEHSYYLGFIYIQVKRLKTTKIDLNIYSSRCYHQESWFFKFWQ